MTSERLRYAIDAGGLRLPESGTIALWGAAGDAVTGPLDASRLEVIQSFAPDHAAWEKRGIAVRTQAGGPYAASIVTLPRARDLAEARLAAAEAATPGGLIVLDGAKTDGVEALAKALKGRVTLDGQVSKAHGKVLWFPAAGALSAWARPAMAPNAQGDMTAPGVFSADGPDPGSQVLAAALPASLKGHWADLGAGWGWLARAVLERDALAALHLVEAEKTALDCARVDVTDARAQFHWADALTWRAPTPLDGIVMNPPFHTGRRADPALGRAFVAAAARQLAPQGHLWMVANRHLPYETTLAGCFREVTEVTGTPKFKILHATRPARTRR